MGTGILLAAACAAAATVGVLLAPLVLGAPGHDIGAQAPHVVAPRSARSPAQLVAAYYAALDARRFSDAWRVLAPGVQRELGGFRRWRDGFATTISSRPERIVAVRRGGGWDVHNVLVARDRTRCGAPLVRRFAIRWRLVPAGGGWVVAALGGTALGPGAHATACG